MFQALEAINKMESIGMGDDELTKEKKYLEDQIKELSKKISPEEILTRAESILQYTKQTESERLGMSLGEFIDDFRRFWAGDIPVETQKIYPGWMGEDFRELIDKITALTKAEEISKKNE